MAALFTVPMVYAVGIAVFFLTGGQTDYINYLVVVLLPVFFLTAIVFGPLAEELGWRGFGVAHLLETRGVFTTSIMVGTVWTFWHTPLFWAGSGTSISGMPISLITILLHFAFVTGVRFLHTWVFKNSGSVLMAFVLLASTNGTGTALKYFTPNLSDPEYYQIFTIAIAAVWSLVLIGALVTRSRTRGGNDREI